MPADQIFVTGNTVIDALMIARAKVKEIPPAIPGLPAETIASWKADPVVLITGHRRENFGSGFESICQAIAELAGRFPRCTGSIRSISIPMCVSRCNAFWPPSVRATFT